MRRALIATPVRRTGGLSIAITDQEIMIESTAYYSGCSGTDAGRPRGLAGKGDSATARYLQQGFTAVPISSLLPSDQLRMNGENREHVNVLAQVDGPLPPILVHRPSMRVIDGMHRLRAAQCRGQTEITVQFFHGTEQDALVLAVEANIAHGLPLTLAERKAAAARIIVSHRQWSDRKIASVTGLAPSTVGALRKFSTGVAGHANTRIGRDGSERPLDAAAGRAHVVKLMAEKPDASIREIARIAGVAPSTAHDVRNRLREGKDPVPLRKHGGRRTTSFPEPDDDVPGPRCGAVQSARNGSGSLPLDHLKLDPALRYSEAGRALLRLLQAQTVIEQASTTLVTAVPAHTAKAVAELAHRAAETWRSFAAQLEQRCGP